MSSDQEDGGAAVRSIWSRLIFKNVQSKMSVDDPMTASAVERQTENSRKGGTIWQTLLTADYDAMVRLVTEDSKNVDARGPVGECPIHMLFLYGTETHLNMARYLIKRFPYTLTQYYNGAVNYLI